MAEPKKEQNSPPSHWNALSCILKEPKLPSFSAQIVFWVLLSGGLAVDLWSKKAVFNRLGNGESITVIDGLVQLVRAENNGAAFGICAGQPLLLSAASIIALVAVLAYLYLFGAKQRMIQIALGLLGAGICGNLYDRLFNGGIVRDFIDVYITAFGRERHWHTFNAADAFLCVGVGLLIIWTGFTGKSDQKCDRQHK